MERQQKRKREDERSKMDLIIPFIKKLDEISQCPIQLEPFTNPVLSIDDGYTYDLEAFTRWKLSNTGSALKSPVTFQTVSGNTTVNRIAKDLVPIVKELKRLLDMEDVKKKLEIVKPSQSSVEDLQLNLLSLNSLSKTLTHEKVSLENERKALKAWQEEIMKASSTYTGFPGLPECLMRTQYGQPSIVKEQWNSLSTYHQKKIRDQVVLLLLTNNESRPFSIRKKELEKSIQEAKLIQLPALKNQESSCLNLSCLNLSQLKLENRSQYHLDLRCSNLEKVIWMGDGSTGTCIHGHFTWSNLRGMKFQDSMCNKCSEYNFCNLEDVDFSGIINNGACSWSGAFLGKESFFYEFTEWEAKSNCESAKQLLKEMKLTGCIPNDLLTDVEKQSVTLNRGRKLKGKELIERFAMEGIILEGVSSE